MIEQREGLPAIALHQGFVRLRSITSRKRQEVRSDCYLTQHNWTWHEVDGELVLVLEKVPPGLDVGDVVGVTDGLDLAGGGACTRWVDIVRTLD